MCQGDICDGDTLNTVLLSRLLNISRLKFYLNDFNICLLVATDYATDFLYFL